MTGVCLIFDDVKKTAVCQPSRYCSEYRIDRRFNFFSYDRTRL